MLESASVSYGKATPYLPVIDLLKRYAHVEERDDSRTMRAKVTGEVLTLDEALQETIPALLALLDALSEDSPFRKLDPPQRRQGDILVASGRLNDAVRALEASIWLAETIQTPLEVWLGKAALGTVLARLRREKEAKAHFIQATQAIEAIADKLQTPRLHQSFLNAKSVLEVYRTLGHRPPPAIP